MKLYLVQHGKSKSKEEDSDRSLTDDVSEAAVHYAKTAKDTVKDMAGAAKKAAQAFTDAFKDQDNS